MDMQSSFLFRNNEDPDGNHIELMEMRPEPLQLKVIAGIRVPAEAGTREASGRRRDTTPGLPLDGV